MTFRRRLLPIADQLITTLDKRYSNLNHNHDAVYSKLGHTHTADQVSGMIGLWDQRSLVVEPVYSTCGQVYEVKQDGWLRVSMSSHEGVALLTIPLSSFDNRIPDYTAWADGKRFNAWENIVKYQGNYWLSRTSGTVGNANDHPGGSDNRWIQLPAWLPSVAIAHCMSGGDADEVSNEVVIPCRAGEQYAYVGLSNTKGIAKECRGYEYRKNTNIVYLQYLPYQYSDDEVGLTVVEDRRLTDNLYRYNNYVNTMTAIPMAYRSSSDEKEDNT